MTAREAETQRRRRERREARERAYREYVCGGPLVDHAAPVMSPKSGESALGHAIRVEAELHERAVRMNQENLKLAWAFAHRCNARLAVRLGMYYLLRGLWRELGMARSVPTHSTAAPTRTLGGTIPRLG